MLVDIVDKMVHVLELWKENDEVFVKTATAMVSTESFSPLRHANEMYGDVDQYA